MASKDVSPSISDGPPELGASKTGDCDSPLLHGWRLSWVLLGLYLGLFTSTLEVSIVGTALLKMSNDLEIFHSSTWIVNAYLLTYTGMSFTFFSSSKWYRRLTDKDLGFLLIWSQFSDVLGRKSCAIAAMVVFTAFSIGCATAQKGTQLIVLRALQGIGGAGLYNMAMVIVAEAVRPQDFPRHVSVVAAVIAISFAVGPLVGGAIVDRTTWRWVFWINVPLGAIGIAIVSLALPNHFPHHNRPSRPTTTLSKSFLRLDFTGAMSFLGSSIPLVTALEQVSAGYSWSSGVVIALLVIFAFFLVVMISWIKLGPQLLQSLVPVLPKEHFRRRCAGLLLVSFFIGGPFTCAVIQIPQRYQTLHGLGALDAGVRFLAFIMMVPLGAVLAAATVEKVKVRITYPMLIGVVLQLAGAIGFAFTPYSTSIRASQYGFQILFGLGSGYNNALTTSSVPNVTERKNVASTLGASGQFRYLGSALGLGIVSAVLTGTLRSALAPVLTSEELRQILDTLQDIALLSPEKQDFVLREFAKGFSLQWKVMLGFVGAQAVSAFLMW